MIFYNCILTISLAGIITISFCLLSMVLHNDVIWNYENKKKIEKGDKK